MRDGHSFCGKMALRRNYRLLTRTGRSDVPTGMLRSRRRLTQLSASTCCRKTRTASLPFQSAQLFSLRPQRDLQTHLVRLRLDKRAPLGSVHLLQQPVAGSLKIGRARLQNFLAVGIAEARVAVARLPLRTASPTLALVSCPSKPAADMFLNLCARARRVCVKA